ncbi:MAG: electron transfer flavoprotein subunit beta/FixA family protein [Candidatus Nezhaarchaeales archaeon]
MSTRPRIGVLVKAALNVGQLLVEDGKPLLESTPLKISDIDRNAVEEAVRIKERLGGFISAFSALTWGPLDKRVEEGKAVLREGLAMGVDEAYLIVDGRLVGADSFLVGTAISTAIKRLGGVDVILAGEGSIDDYAGQVGPRVAEELGIPVVSYARRIDVKDKALVVERDLEGHIEVVEVKPPAFVSVTREINLPRLPTSLQVRMAFRKPLKVLSLSDLGVEAKALTSTVSLKGLQVRRKKVAIKGDDVNALAENLVKELLKEGVL